jgi:hypothetical protein
MSQAEPPVIAYHDAHCMVATWRWVVIPVMGRSALPATSARLQVRAIEEHGKRVGKGKLGEMTLIADEAPLPGPETRAALDAGVPVVSPYYGCVSAVFEGTGFRAAMVRGLLVSLQLLSRNRFPQQTFATIDDAARWMAPHLQGLGMTVSSSEEIAGAARAVREIAVQRGVFGRTVPA